MSPKILFFVPLVVGSTIRGRNVRGPAAPPFGHEKQEKVKLSPVIKMPKRGSDPLDPMCLADTGFKCGDGKHNCNDWVACSEESHTCTCHHWGCADSAGMCRPIKNQWFPDESRLMPIAAGKPGAPHRFAMMPTTNITLQDGWPAGEHPEALWKFLIMNDNATLLITTKQGMSHNDAKFLSLPPARLEGPGNDAVMIDPIQVKPQDALQASWRLVERPHGKTALQHVPSGRFLCYDNQHDKLSTCAGKHCKVESADFDIWPKIVGIPMLKSTLLLNPDGSEPPKLPKKDPNPLYSKTNQSKPVQKQKDTSTPWYLRKNSSKNEGIAPAK